MWRGERAREPEPLGTLIEIGFQYPGSNRPALENFSLSLWPGSLTALIGPNGAGKTTALRCLAGFLKPQTGKAMAFSMAPSRQNLDKMGILLDQPGLYKKMKAGEYLTFFSNLFHLDSARSPWQPLCALLEIDPDKPIDRYSLGERQKLHLARCFLHRPRLLLLDEPLSHLDPMAQESVLEWLRRYAQEKKAAILVTSHQLNLVEESFSHFAIIKGGENLHGDSVESWRRNQKISGVSIEFIGAPKQSALGELAHEFKLALRLELSEVGVTKAIFNREKEDLNIPSLVSELVQRGYSLQSVQPQKSNLKQFYQSIIGKEN